MKAFGIERNGVGSRVVAMGLAALAALALAAAAAEAAPRKGDKKPAADPKQAADERYRQEPTYPTRTTWALRTLNGKPVPAEYDVTFMIDDNFRGSGFGGCNYWSATVFPQRGQRLASGPIATTKKQCDAARTQIERNFLVAIHSGPAWSIEGSQMTMKAGPMTLVFDRAF